MAKTMEKKPQKLKNIFSPLYDFDKSIAEEVHKDSLIGFKYFSYAGIVGYSYMLYYNIYIEPEAFNIILRLVNIFTCALFLYLLKRKIFQNLKMVTSIAFIIIILSEIESQHHGFISKFYDIQNWIAYPMIMSFHTFFFMGTPLTFLIIWLSILFLYIGRCLLFYPEIPLGFVPVIMIFLYTSIWTLLSVLLNLFWFKIRYKNILITTDLENANEKIMRDHEHRLEIERNFARLKERERIFTDIHDHLGANLTDILILFNKLSDKEKPSKSVLKRIRELIHSVNSNIRNRLHLIEDMKLLSENFFEGLQLTLLRRYSNSGRKIKFKASDELKKLFEQKKYSFQEFELFAIINEITSNDLRYGLDISTWKFSLINKNKDCQMKINLNTATSFDKKNSKPGYGTANILSRIKKLEGQISSAINENNFKLTIHVPLKK